MSLFSPERRHIYESNFAFLADFRATIKDIIVELPSVRVLDYGAGVFPYPYGLFSLLHSEEETIAYDPDVDMKHYNSTPEAWKIAKWTDIAPVGQKFDLVICHFSMHHMSGEPTTEIKDLEDYSPQFVAVADYDYSGVSEGDFEKTFVADAELNELEKLFKKDVAACHKLHSKYNRSTFQDALTKNGYQIIRQGTGEGVAKHKFFLIG